MYKCLPNYVCICVLFFGWLVGLYVHVFVACYFDVNSVKRLYVFRVNGRKSRAGSTCQ